MHAFLRDRRGIESSEIAAIIALFVVVAALAFGTFGNKLAEFILGLGGRLGF